MNRRIELVNSIEFRKKSAEIAKQIGITSEEWEKNKAMILMHFANTVCKLENNQ